MTREEAIEVIEQDIPCEHDTDLIEALEWAIKALEQEPCDDVVSRQAVLKIIDGWYEQNRDTENIEDLIVLITYMDSARPLEPKGKCRTCKYGEIYNDLWCKCHDPLLNGVMVKMTDQCRAEEIIDLNRKYRAESEDKE
jgi:hypothetical protein